VLELALNRVAHVRQRTMQLIKPLAVEDMLLQAMTDVSPTKWHLAHTTWFFETFILLKKKTTTPFIHRFSISLILIMKVLAIIFHGHSEDFCQDRCCPRCLIIAPTSMMP